MFRFKEFTIQQDRTAMKVCTDACVLGAYADVAKEFDEAGSVMRILDIGTGTGLLALMAAQRNPAAIIDGVEIDEGAYVQASENVQASPFASRIRVTRGRIQDFRPEVLYDRILTNPPFYTNHLRSPDAAVNRALHTDELPFADLLTAVKRLMKPDGQWWVLLPPVEAANLVSLAEPMGLFVNRRLFLKHNEEKPVFRVITGFSAEKSSIQDETLKIYEPVVLKKEATYRGKETYTTQFYTLLRDFYLIF